MSTIFYMLRGVSLLPGSAGSSAIHSAYVDAAPDENGILDGATALLAEGRWSLLTRVGVSARLGRVGRPARGSGRSRVDLARRVWVERAGPPLVAALKGCLSGLEQARARGDRAPLVAAFAACRVRSVALDAGVELLIRACFDEELARVVIGQLAAEAIPRVSPSLASDEATAARASYAGCLSLGLLMLARSEGMQMAGLPQALDRQADALLCPTGVATIAAVHVKDPVRPDYLAPTDPQLDRLLKATVDRLTRVGFDELRVAEVARAAGCTEGLIYRRYAGKQALALDAMRRHYEAMYPFDGNHAERLRATYGLGLAQAMMLREYLGPSQRTTRLLVMEQLRMTWNDPQLMSRTMAALDAQRAIRLAGPTRRFQGASDHFLEYALTRGAAVMSMLVPQIDRLPYEVISLPVSEGVATREPGSA